MLTQFEYTIFFCVKIDVESSSRILFNRFRSIFGGTWEIHIGNQKEFRWEVLLLGLIMKPRSPEPFLCLHYVDSFGRERLLQLLWDSDRWEFVEHVVEGLLSRNVEIKCRKNHGRIKRRLGGS
jgi:hypothetical protein